MTEREITRRLAAVEAAFVAANPPTGIKAVDVKRLRDHLEDDHPQLFAEAWEFFTLQERERVLGIMELHGLDSVKKQCIDEGLSVGEAAARLNSLNGHRA